MFQHQQTYPQALGEETKQVSNNQFCTSFSLLFGDVELDFLIRVFINTYSHHPAAAVRLVIPDSTHCSLLGRPAGQQARSVGSWRPCPLVTADREGSEYSVKHIRLS